MMFADAIVRPVHGHPGYRVTYSGDVQSCRPLNGQGPLLGEWRTMARVYSGGRQMVSLGGKSYQVSRLVCKAFHGPGGGLVCCHNDGNPANNNAWNLRWDTQAGNLSDRNVHGTMMTGSKNHNTKLTADQAAEIRSLKSQGVRYCELSRRFLVHKKTVRAIVERKTWRHVG